MIGSVDVDIIGLTEITKLDFFKQQQNISRPHLRFAQSGWANMSSNSTHCDSQQQQQETKQEQQRHEVSD